VRGLDVVHEISVDAVKSGYHFEAKHAARRIAMKATSRFSDEQLAALNMARGIHIRAGLGTHRFIGIWFVLVEGRVFVRSWSVKPNGWYRTFLRDPRGKVQLGKIEIAIRAIPIRSKSLRDAVDKAYLERYNTAGAIKYAKDLGMEKSRATTLELVPRTERRSSSHAKAHAKT
jgi:hypothetical protein